MGKIIKTFSCELSGRRSSKLLAEARACTVSVYTLNKRVNVWLLTVHILFTFSLSHFGERTFKCGSNLSRWLVLYRPPWLKIELLHQLLHTLRKAFSPGIRSFKLHINTPRYSCCYGVAFILQIGVFVLQTFFRNRAILEADGSVSSQCAELRKNNALWSYMNSKLK